MEKTRRVAQVFDCQDMPSELREKYFRKVRGENDIYVEWYWTDMEYYKRTDRTFEDFEIVHFEIQKWLLENGVVFGERGYPELVLIKHWW